MSFFSDRITIPVQIGLAIALMAMAYQRVDSMNDALPKVNSMERRFAVAYRCIAACAAVGVMD